MDYSSIGYKIGLNEALDDSLWEEITVFLFDDIQKIHSNEFYLEFIKGEVDARKSKDAGFDEQAFIKGYKRGVTEALEQEEEILDCFDDALNEKE